MDSLTLEVCACSLNLLLLEGDAVISYSLSGTLSESLLGCVPDSSPTLGGRGITLVERDLLL